MTSSLKGKITPPSPSLRYRKAELILPVMTRFAKTLALLGGSALRELVRRLWMIPPSRTRTSISPSFHNARRLAKHSWCSFALDFWLGFCNPTARRTVAALRAMCFISDSLFQSFMCCVNLSMKAFPVFP